MRKRIDSKWRSKAIVSALFASTLVVLTAVSPAQALGNKSVSCSPYYAGTLSAGSYQNSFSNAGGYTSRSSCGSQVSIYLRYQSYPGSPTYTTSTSVGSTYISRVQSGTVGGVHWGSTGTGGGVPSVST